MRYDWHQFPLLHDDHVVYWQCSLGPQHPVLLPFLYHTLGAPSVTRYGLLGWTARVNDRPFCLYLLDGDRRVHLGSVGTEDNKAFWHAVKADLVEKYLEPSFFSLMEQGRNR